MISHMNFKEFYFCSIKSYQSSVDSLNLKPVILTTLLSPVFYLLFFFMVRFQTIDPENIPLFLLQSILILPIGLCVFYVGTSFSKLKQWGVINSLLLTDTGLFNIAIQIAVVATTISFFVSLFWFSVIELFFMDFNLSIGLFFEYLVVLFLSILVASAFGLLIAVLILPLKERFFVVNSLFFILIIFSGLMFQSESGWLYWVSHALPLTPFVSATRIIGNGQIGWGFILIGIFNLVWYILLAYVLINRMLVKMQEGNADY